MSNKRSFDKVEGGISAGVFHLVRLVKKGPPETVIIGWNKNGKEEAKKRFDYIKLKLSDLEPGSYFLEACTSLTSSGLKERFPLEVAEKKTIPVVTHAAKKKKEPGSVEDPSVEEPQVIPSEMDLEDYKNLVNENAELRATVQILTHQLQQLESKKDLSDAPVKPSWVQVIEDNFPAAMNILDKFLDQRDRQLGIKEREISMAENGGGPRNGKKTKRVLINDNGRVSKEEILEKFRQLQQTADEDTFNAELDNLERQDPELYDYVCNEMGLYEEGEEEETE